MKKVILFISILIQLVTVGKLKAQMDPHFSQYYAYPLWLNPALTGVIDGNLRINANFKDQWVGIPNGYKTGGLSMDFKSGDKVGLGLNILNQAAGTAGYNYFALYGSFGYGIAISPDGTQKLHFGLQAGFINRSFDPSKLQFDDQYDSGLGGFNSTTPSYENIGNPSATVFDAAAGIFYYDGDPMHTANMFAGVSVGHLTSPHDPFAPDGIASKLPMRFTAHAGVKIKATDDIDLTPHGVFISQQGNQIKALGLYSEMKLPEDNGLILGAMYRIGNAAVADVGYHLQNLVIGVSYDFTTSPLRSTISGQGGFELSLTYTFKHGINPASVCPKF